MTARPRLMPFVDQLQGHCLGVAVLLFLVLGANVRVCAAENSEAALEKDFSKTVSPFLAANCLSCHGGSAPEAELDLTSYATVADVKAAFGTWEIILERVEAGEMPPEDAEQQPSPGQRQAVVDWIRALRRREADRTAGDPGRVLARRLSNAEYNYTIRDLTGVDLQPAKEFPVDPANEAGFDNTGDSLTMTPALLGKYLDAARFVSNHLVLKPDGFDFAQHPAVTDTDRDKYCVRRIIDFYQQQRTDYADYFEAAWRYKHRAALGLPAASLTEIAAADGLSPKYLNTLWSLLADKADGVGPLAKLQAMWRAIPSPEPENQDKVRRQCEQMREYVASLRSRLAMQFPKLRVRGMHAGSQPLVLWRNRQYATHRRTLNREALQIEGESLGEGVQRDSDLTIPADSAEQARHVAAFERFCSVFPDAFFVSERGREFLDRDEKEVVQEQGRLLSAGFHSMMGYFRDDAPLYELLLDEAQQRELDALWQELDFIANAPARQHTGFIWFERTDSRFMISEEFDFARAEDKDVTSEPKIRRLSDVYLAKASRQGAGLVERAAIQEHFEKINASIRWVEQARLAAEPKHLDALVQFAERAYRRPILPDESAELLGFYHELRGEHGLRHDEAIRDALASVLVSPRFLYRTDSVGAGDRVEPLPGYALANRLSYFLWSSMPDEELLACAADGSLHRPEILLAQSRRMLKDRRAWGLATEFAGHWLDFRRFEDHNSVDRQRYPNFDSELRQAMFEEPLRFFVDVLQQDGSILDFLYADHTFVNAPLARHYGIDGLDLAPGEWIRVDSASAYHRGGLLPMAVFLTKNSPGLRTSPVQRGYWVVRRLLGEHIPPPPPNVPELPNDESQWGELTLRELLAKHREDPSCATCHERFDGLGLAFEAFGPIGERRTEDLGGRTVDAGATFPGGSQGTDLSGLRTYLREHRQEEFVENFCRKLLSYGLGRSLMPSDDATLRDMKTSLASNGYRLSSAVETVVTSRQFLTRRGRDELNQEP